MKQTIRWLLALVAACAASSLVTYGIAYRKGEVAMMDTTSMTTSFITLNALQ